jgi:hypothetical protein
VIERLINKERTNESKACFVRISTDRDSRISLSNQQRTNAGPCGTTYGGY